MRRLGRVGQGIHSGRSASNKFMKHVVRRVQKGVVLNAGAIPAPALQVVDPIERLARGVLLERVTTALRRRRGNIEGQRDGIEGSKKRDNMSGERSRGHGGKSQGVRSTSSTGMVRHEWDRGGKRHINV